MLKLIDEIGELGRYTPAEIQPSRSQKNFELPADNPALSHLSGFSLDLSDFKFNPTSWLEAAKKLEQAKSPPTPEFQNHSTDPERNTKEQERKAKCAALDAAL